MLTPEQEELQIIESKINDAIFALNRAQRTGNPGHDYLCSIATSLIAIAKLLQLQAEQNQDC